MYWALECQVFTDWFERNPEKNQDIIFDPEKNDYREHKLITDDQKATIVWSEELLSIWFSTSTLG